MISIINIDKIEKSVLATLRIEGLTPSKAGIKTTRDFLNNKITSQEAVARIKKYWLNKYKNN